ncbi:hypothetical protein FKD06_07745 [Serratia sp. SRS-8-S-2018]|uniref:hypothetical protein n=1 Tax=Serratia TaxID=613 RepID=UPI00101FA9B7|nr:MULTISPECIES: hypothetical protein [Serratia]RZF18057.1 hypothetical protein B7L62_09995 [Serratia marcescens]TPW52391.1 hypothetical protein FKD06_07745 [Serratia sp. SRS-8-S-2018]
MVQRYNPDYVMHAARFEPFARENEHGEFVKFSDYEALVSELASSRQINAQTLQVKLTMAESIKKLTDRVNALAVENASFKHALSVILEHVGVTDKGQAGVVAMIANDELFNSETTATSAALAAIRLEAKIEGANELAERIAEMHSKTAPGSNIEKKLMFAAEAAIAYANGLWEAK